MSCISVLSNLDSFFDYIYIYRERERGREGEREREREREKCVQRNGYRFNEMELTCLDFFFAQLVLFSSKQWVKGLIWKKKRLGLARQPVEEKRNNSEFKIWWFLFGRINGALMYCFFLLSVQQECLVGPTQIYIPINIYVIRTIALIFNRRLAQSYVEINHCVHHVYIWYVCFFWFCVCEGWGAVGVFTPVLYIFSDVIRK